MTTVLKVITSVLGVLFLIIGVAAMFSPENFAGSMGLSLASPEGAGTVRAMIGAHYVAMGGVCVYAIARQQPLILLPIAAIEALMVCARGLAALNGEFSSATILPTAIELIAALSLAAAAVKLLQAQAE